MWLFAFIVYTSESIKMNSNVANFYAHTKFANKFNGNLEVSKLQIPVLPSG